MYINVKKDVIDVFFVEVPCMRMQPGLVQGAVLRERLLHVQVETTITAQPGIWHVLCGDLWNQEDSKDNGNKP